MDETYPADDPSYGGAMTLKHTGMALGSLRTPPVRKVVEAQIEELEKQLKERREFLELLSSNPGVEAVLDKMRKLSI